MRMARSFPSFPATTRSISPGRVSHGTDALNAHLDAIYSHALLGLSRERPEIVHNNALHRYPSAWSAIRRAPMVSTMHVPPFGALERAIHAHPRPWSLTTVTSGMQLRRWWGDAARDGVGPAQWHRRDGVAVPRQRRVRRGLGQAHHAN